MVGCVYYETLDAVILIDPLAPPDGTSDAERFWRALDRDVERLGLPVAVLLCSDWHERSAQAVADRYGHQPANPNPREVQIWAHPAARDRVSCAVTHLVAEPDPGAGETPVGKRATLPGGLQAHAIGVPYPSEVAYYLPRERALVYGDCLIGAGSSQVRVCPAWWVDEDPTTQGYYRTAFRPTLRRLLDLPIDLLLTSHGEPVLEGGRAALARALDAPAWGE